MATSLFHVSGAAEPSSKNDRGKVAACGGPSAGVVNEVVEGPMIGIAVKDTFGVLNVSARERVPGDVPLIESIEVAGETPSDN